MAHPAAAIVESTENSSSESDSECKDLSLTPPKPKKSSKLSGAATYKTKFYCAWINEYPFSTSVPGNPYRYSWYSTIAYSTCCYSCANVLFFVCANKC